MRICVSLPVHEQAVCVLDLINNIFKHLKDCFIVLLINVEHRDAFLREAKVLGIDFSKMDNVYVNMDDCTFYDRGCLIRQHNSNFSYADKIERFDRFLLHSSNDMYIQSLGDIYLSEHKCGLQRIECNNTMEWCQSKVAYSDADFLELLKICNLKQVYGSQVEGSFYSYDVFKCLVELIHNNYKENRIWYCREEIFYPTLAHGLFKETITGRNIVYSEVITGKETTIDTIDRIFKKNVERHNYTGMGKYASPNFLYDFDNLYAVKRVKRSIEDPIRKYINSL